MIYTGSCYCCAITYELDLAFPDDARTSLCHCHSCKVKPVQQIDVSSRDENDRKISDFCSQKAFGTNYGLTAKVPKDCFKLTKGHPKEYKGDNGSGAIIYREFCDTCGSFILEYGVSLDFSCVSAVCSHGFVNVLKERYNAPQEGAKDHFRYICVGSLDDPEALPPKGEFFCQYRASWMPEVPSEFHRVGLC